MSHKIVLLNDTSDEEHWGCIAAGGYIKKITEGLDDVSLISRYSVQFSWQFKPCPLTLHEALEVVKLLPKELSTLKEDMESSSMVVVNAEGTLLSNRPPVRNILLFIILAFSLNKPVAILNATISPYTINLSASHLTQIIEMYKYVLPKCGLVCVRESRSYHIAKTLGARNVWHHYDASLAHLDGYNINNKVHATEPCIIFGSVRLNEKMLARLQSFLIKFQKITNVQFKIFSMGGAELKYLKKLSFTLNCEIVSPRQINTEELAFLLVHSPLVISGRYHGCVLSSATNVPFIHYDTHSEKIDEFCRHLCYPWGKISLFSRPETENINKALYAFQNKKAIVTHLRSGIKHLKLKSIAMKATLSDFWLSFKNESKNGENLNGNPCSFSHRARIASQLLPDNLRILDIGGFMQDFGLVYAFSSYASIDILSRPPPLGQPKNHLPADGMPFPLLHHEADINQIVDFSIFGEFDYVILLGVLTWLENWQRTLLYISKSGINGLLISWDRWEIQWVEHFLSDLGYILKDDYSINKKSKIARFVRDA